jgi:hypothetical protein
MRKILTPQKPRCVQWAVRPSLRRGRCGGQQGARDEGWPAHVRRTASTPCQPGPGPRALAKRARLCMLNGAFVSSSSPPVAQILRRRRSRREWLSITTDRGELRGYAAVPCPRLVAPRADEPSDRRLGLARPSGETGWTDLSVSRPDHARRSPPDKACPAGANLGARRQDLALTVEHLGHRLQPSLPHATAIPQWFGRWTDGYGSDGRPASS